MISFHQSGQMNIEDVLGQEGLVAQCYEGFEIREQQIKMASAVQQALCGGYHLAVEAGTGVGKSFAYLVAVIDQVLRKEGKVVISTYTITLQEQLINKDIPFLAEIMDHEFTACLAKGRGNYLCLRRLEYAQRKQQNLFGDFGAELAEINQWSKDTDDGSLSDLGKVPSPDVWDAVKSEHGNCRGRKCPHYRECFYWKARRRLECADIIVVNHALLFSDLVLKQEMASVLPEYSFVVIDEAHNIEHVAEGHFGINITNYTISYLLRNLYNRRNQKGLLALIDSNEARKLVGKCDDASKVFFAQIQAWYAHAKAETSGRCHPEFVEDNITGPLKELRLCLAKLGKEIEDEDEKLEFERYVDRCRALEVGLKDFLAQPRESNVYWVEVSQGRRKRISLRSAPLDTGPEVKRCLFDMFSSVICTSATLSCGGSGKQGFEFFTGRIGLEEFEALQLGSPFDYQNQVTMYIESQLPEPNSRDFEAGATEAIKKYLLKTDGKAFVLFTSYAMLKNISEKIADFFTDNEMELLCQGAGKDRTTLLDKFKANKRSVLFGTDSFWQGVDVPGESLSNVIIVKLPFAVPNHPLVQGRIEKLKAEGENPFYKFQLPTAIIKFKQGFGRLIRNKTDTGIIVVLDSRIVRKSYGKSFIAAIPPCRVEIVTDEF